MGTYTGQDKRLKYLFENGGGGGGASALSQLTDVELTNLTNDQILIYQSSISKWINKNIDGSGSKIVTITKPMTGNNSGYFTGFTDENGNALNPDEYILFDISATTSSQYYLGLPFVLSGNYLARMQLSLVPSYVEYVKTAMTLNVRYSYMKKSGICTVNYSTNEQIIGTWIDGKTLYRRTLTGLSIALNGANWVNYNPNISIDKLINVHAYYSPSSSVFLTCALAEYQYYSSYGIQLSATSSTFNRTIHVMTIEYTKTV